MTIGQPKKLIIDSPIPSQQEIRHRMERNFGRASMLVKSILSPCAEEAERILLDVVTSNSLKKPVRITMVKHQSSRHLNRKRKSGYACPSCRQENINLNSHYCPGCGKPIEWY